jgi:hypothetical protein
VHLGLWGNGLTGAIPDVFANLKELEFVWLNSNMLTGSIPESLAVPPAIYIYIYIYI